jgi:hypothetical protein
MIKLGCVALGVHGRGWLVAVDLNGPDSTHRAAGGNLHGTPSKPAIAPSASDRAHDQVTQCYDQRLSAHQLNVYQPL